MNRRRFLGTIAYVLVAAHCGSTVRDVDGNDAGGEGGDGGPDANGGETSKPVTPTSSKEESHRVFPQGVASGDPKPDQVVLWTRLEPTAVTKNGALPSSLLVEYIVSEDEALTKIVARGSQKVSKDGDYTFRLVAQGLTPRTTYYYRFQYEALTTQVGRTRTAPGKDDDVDITFVLASCQDFVGRYYHSWQAFLEEKIDADFILFMGDYIYESVGDPRFQNTGSTDRKVTLPDGFDASPAQDGSETVAGTLADYRELYKTYRKDEMLREVHRLFPFVNVWDDHEFADDCWQDHTTFFNEKDPKSGGFTDEKRTQRRRDANRAWAEYQPVDIEYKPAAAFPNDITIYRTLRYGKRMELFLTDQRLYRDDHVIPEGPRDILDGKLVANSNFQSRVFVRKSVFDKKEAEKQPTLLGPVQKQWFVDAVKNSDATWKIWGNEVQLHQQVVDFGKIDGVPDFLKTNLYLNVDQWDGYRSERREILTALRDVKNIVACTGDIHCFFAAEVYVDFDTPVTPMAVEYVTSSITSATFKELLTKFTNGNALLKPVANLIGNGAEPALVERNPHIKHIDVDVNGFVVATVEKDNFRATMYGVKGVSDKKYPGIVSRTKLKTPSGTSRVYKDV